MEDVKFRIDKQYPTRSNNTERLPADSVIRGKAATISASKVEGGKQRNPKRVCRVFSNDVTISMKASNSTGSARKKTGSKR